MLMVSQRGLQIPPGVPTKGVPVCILKVRLGQEATNTLPGWLRGFRDGARRISASVPVFHGGRREA